MVVKNQIKLIKSLQQKKYRIRHGLFVVEGIKTVEELLNSSFEVDRIYTTNTNLIALRGGIAELISEGELQQMSGLKSPNKVLGVFKIPKPKPIGFEDWVVVLDDIRDPGNLGTIIRLCDWFGIKHLICSEQTVDCFNPKVLQATMGSIARVNISYERLYDFLSRSQVPIYGAFMDGEKVYTSKLPKTGILVLGNEASGISDKVKQLTTTKINIPQFGRPTAESLNVAMATAILLNEIRRD